MSEETKRCSRCKREFPLTGFCRNKSRKDGLQGWCRECRAEMRKKYYYENRESASAYNKKYHKEHLEERTVGRREYHKEYNKKHRDRKRSQWLQLQSYARKKRWNCDISEVTFTRLRSRSCFYCGADLPVSGYGLDRLDSSKGYMKGNVVPCCWPCNQEKGSMPWQAFALMKENRSLDEIPISERSYHMLLGYWKLWEEDVSD